jgi:hypothetical protein
LSRGLPGIASVAALTYAWRIHNRKKPLITAVVRLSALFTEERVIAENTYDGGWCAARFAPEIKRVVACQNGDPFTLCPRSLSLSDDT